MTGGSLPHIIIGICLDEEALTSVLNETTKPGISIMVDLPEHEINKEMNEVSRARQFLGG